MITKEKEEVKKYTKAKNNKKEITIETMNNKYARRWRILLYAIILARILDFVKPFRLFCMVWDSPKTAHPTNFGLFFATYIYLHTALYIRRAHCRMLLLEYWDWLSFARRPPLVVGLF